MQNYQNFIDARLETAVSSGIDPAPIHERLYPFQSAIVEWALKRGKAAIFADTGLGKTLMQLEWARQISEIGPVLIVAPLCVSDQTIKEGSKIGLDVYYHKSQPDISSGILITNYERLDGFDLSNFTGIVLDESSILKHIGSKTRSKIIESAQVVPYRLSCTATPAPNDYMEFGGQVEFLGLMSTSEMLATYFIHDGGDTSKWRLKGHARKKFWGWMATWALMMRKPSDIGFDDGGFDLPPLNYHEHSIESGQIIEGFLFPVEAETLQERLKARRVTIDARCKLVADMVNQSDEQWLIWCHLNDESELLGGLIHDAVTVAGADSIDKKQERINGFTAKTNRVLVTKPSIAGFGMNWQQCRNMAFVGLNDSWEQLYQAIRRCWRYGQDRPVNVHLVTSDIEGAVLQNLKRKENQAQAMHSSIVDEMRGFMQQNIKHAKRERVDYMEDHASGKDWDLYHGDCIEVIKEIESDSIGFSVFSPPFSSLYTYSNSARDMGNAKGDDDFFEHFDFLVKELYRITMPGRHVAFHCMNIPSTIQKDGVIAIKDFRGDMIRAFENQGFLFHSEVVIWKDPVTQMQRTKALGLLHKTIRKDSAMSRMGLPDYVVTMRKPGINPVPIPHNHDNYPVSHWQKVASPIWMDINPSDTLNRKGAKDQDDERHIAPLQLEVIERCMALWSGPNDLVFSPFAGIGSEGYQAIKMGRCFIGAELKKSYFDIAKRNLQQASDMDQQEMTL